MAERLSLDLVTELRCTYRLQLGPGLSFAEARALVPYLRELGVSHLYLSPSLQARAGSTHGYDVADPTRISEELGGEEEFRALCEAGLGVVLDIVPNHMAASDENPFWRDPLWRAKFFDLDWRTGSHRRFFDVGELAGVRQEDPEVFEVTHAKILELVREGLVGGLRIDHPDGLANPADYLRRLRDSGVEQVWVEKILKRDERLRDWPVEGTTGYEFANDATALFVDPRSEERLTRLYGELSGLDTSWQALAEDCKLEQARTTFEPEVERLRASLGEAAEGIDLAEALASLHVYRTYVEPETGHFEPGDLAALAMARLPSRLAAILALDERAHDVFVTRFQQTTPAVVAKGVEDTALYLYNRLLALNEVGGDPSHFSLRVEEFHARNLERAERFPHHLLATTTHDTKRSGDVRARLVALTWVPDEWEALVRRLRSDFGTRIDGNDEYLVYQTVVGAWPLERERLDGYLEKALREGKRTSSWLAPDEAAERRVQEFAREVGAHLAVQAFVERIAALEARITLGMTLLKLTSPGVPDIYQGDEIAYRALVDPDNRRPVDWDLRRRLLAADAPDPEPKLFLIRRALELRARRPGAFAGSYEQLDAGPDICAFVRGGEVLVAVPVRDGARFEPPAGWRDVLASSLPVTLLEKG